MLEIVIPGGEGFDELSGTFFNADYTVLQLEHSLVSVSEWEKRWHKPFLGNNEKSAKEIQDYIQCMTLNDVTDKTIYRHLPLEAVDQITKYIKDPMTATTFAKNEEKKAGFGARKVITSEVIYAWMATLQIPVEFQYWHLNRLMTLIKVVNLQNSPKKKMGKAEEARQRRALVEARRKKYKTRG